MVYDYSVFNLNYRQIGGYWSIPQSSIHLLLLQSWLPFNNASNELNGPGWFLSVMLFLWIVGYIVRPWLFGSNCNYKKLLYYSFMTIIGYAFLIMISGSIEKSFFVGIYQIWPELAFFFGMIVGKLYALGIGWDVFCGKRFVNIAFICGLILVWCIPKGNFCNAVATFYFGALIFYLMVDTDKSNVWARFLSYKPFVIGGNCSLEIYLIHIPIVRTISPIFSHFHLNFAIGEFVLVWILTFLLSYLYNNTGPKIQGLLGSRRNI